MIVAKLGSSLAPEMLIVSSRCTCIDCISGAVGLGWKDANTIWLLIIRCKLEEGMSSGIG